MSLRKLSIFAVAVSILTLPSLILTVEVDGPTDGVEDDGYYDEYYEDGEEGDGETAVESIRVDGSVADSDSFPDAAAPKVDGYFKNVGGGILKIKQPLVNELYINETSEAYGCVIRRLAFIPKIEEPEEEDEPQLEAQIHDLRRKMEEVSAMATALASGKDPQTAKESAAAASTAREKQENAQLGRVNGTDPTSADNSTATDEEESGSGSKKKPKRLSFREKQELKMRETRAKEAAREMLRPKFLLGADCETLVCGSCKAIVGEFGTAVHEGIANPEMRYIEDLSAGFCQSKNIALKYVDMVGDICANFEQEALGYKEALMRPFEEDHNWRNVLSPAGMFQKKKQICTAVGACEESEFEFQSKAEKVTQEQWDDKCFTCQAFARDLEEVMQLTRHVTERGIIPMVAGTCDRLNLPAKYQSVCKPLTQGTLLDDISWLAKVHGESVIKRAKGELRFQDKLCEEINYCQPYVEPDQLREKVAQQSVEAMFF